MLRLFFFLLHTCTQTCMHAQSNLKWDKKSTLCLLSSPAMEYIWQSHECINVFFHCRTVVKNSPEIVRSSLLPFFNNAADDLANLVENLENGRFSHVKGTITRGATSLNYVHMVLLPVLSSLFDHVGLNQFGNDLIGKWQTPLIFLLY